MGFITCKGLLSCTIWRKSIISVMASMTKGYDNGNDARETGNQQFYPSAVEIRQSPFQISMCSRCVVVVFSLCCQRNNHTTMTQQPHNKESLEQAESLNVRGEGRTSAHLMAVHIATIIKPNDGSANYFLKRFP